MKNFHLLCPALVNCVVASETHRLEIELRIQLLDMYSHLKNLLSGAELRRRILELQRHVNGQIFTQCTFHATVRILEKGRRPNTTFELVYGRMSKQAFSLKTNLFLTHQAALEYFLSGGR